ncbi:FecR domain-containing protein [Chitinophaga niabensis]|uniref:FecR family protein n=1 Tax=Chitinophaga niabensis TaxID=536979 RepID=UPI0031BAB3FC
MTFHERFAYLLKQAAQHSATADELEELGELLKKEEISPELLPDMPPVSYDAAHWDNIASNILAADKVAKENIIPIRAKRRWLWAAAGVALLITAAGYFLLQPKAVQQPITAVKQSNTQDIAPGGNRATLVLGDGSQLTLDSAANGTLSQQGNTQVVKLANGQLAYHTAGQSSTQTILYNTIFTPRGGKYKVTLPDGSKVWLNAASSLRYPTAFTDTRSVELNGEAYFDIAPDASHPFIVSHGKTVVEVLGTTFNMMAYTDEASIRTTLLSGAVKVNGQKLTPGQCASITNGQLRIEEEVNTEAAVAWKNGYIQFEGNDIRSAMRQISRWYDVEVTYKGEVPSHFRGIIPSDVPVSEVLKMMEMTGEVTFEISGRTIIVSPGK